MELGKNIVLFRKEQKLSQEELAELMNVSRQTISNWELGETMPLSEQVIKLAKIFKKTTDELLGVDTKDIIINRVNGTKELMKKQFKFTKILFIVIYLIVLLALIIFTIYLFSIKDFTYDYEEAFSCTLDSYSYNFVLSPGEYNTFDEETNTYKVIDNSIWRIHVEKYDKDGNVFMKDTGFSAGYSYKEAMDSLNLMKYNIIRRGGTCK